MNSRQRQTRKTLLHSIEPLEQAPRALQAVFPEGSAVGLSIDIN